MSLGRRLFGSLLRVICDVFFTYIAALMCTYHVEQHLWSDYFVRICRSIWSYLYLWELSVFPSPAFYYILSYSIMYPCTMTNLPLLQGLGCEYWVQVHVQASKYTACLTGIYETGLWKLGGYRNPGGKISGVCVFCSFPDMLCPG